jgi:hypothetical protein
MRDALAYLAAVILAAWGVIHVAPTRQVVTSMEVWARMMTYRTH